MSGEKVQIMEPSHGIIQSPDGEMHYYTTTIKNKHNPYLHQSPLDEENGVEYHEVECNGERILLSVADVNRAVQLECKDYIVRVLCLMDFMMNLFIGWGDIYFTTIYSTIIAIISFMGYFSTLTYSRYGLISYLIYQYLQTIAKLSFIGIYIAASTSIKLKNEFRKENIYFLNPNPTNITILVFTTLGQIYITYFIQNFYNILPHQRRQLQTSSHHTV